MAARAPAASQDVFAAMNITPLIDVLLVLLVMLILSIPIATQKVPIDLPVRGGGVETVPPHRLDISAAGALRFDGRAVDDAGLARRLAAMHAEAPDAVLQLATDPAARYERFDQVLAVVKRAGIARLGFVGNQPLRD